ncbi:MAG: hypothetical protein V4671_21520 [Armatimonadota bacterium]
MAFYDKATLTTTTSTTPCASQRTIIDLAELASELTSVFGRETPADISYGGKDGVVWSVSLLASPRVHWRKGVVEILEMIDVIPSTDVSLTVTPEDGKYRCVLSSSSVDSLYYLLDLADAVKRHEMEESLAGDSAFDDAWISSYSINPPMATPESVDALPFAELSWNEPSLP